MKDYTSFFQTKQGGLEKIFDVAFWIVRINLANMLTNWSLLLICFFVLKNWIKQDKLKVSQLLTLNVNS